MCLGRPRPASAPPPERPLPETAALPPPGVFRRQIAQRRVESLAFQVDQPIIGGNAHIDLRLRRLECRQSGHQPQRGDAAGGGDVDFAAVAAPRASRHRHRPAASAFRRPRAAGPRPPGEPEPPISRWKSRTPSCSSSVWICRPMADWVRCSSAAASVKLRCRAADSNPSAGRATAGGGSTGRFSHAFSHP